MVDTITLLALGLMLAGVVGSVVPLLPSGLLSLAGVYVYVFRGPTEVGLILLVSVTVVGLVAVVLEHAGGAIAARASGASTGTMILAGMAGLVLFLFTGPIGILIGMFGTVFGLELWRGADARDAARRACFTVLGILGSTVLQAVLTLSILVAFVLFVIVLG